ncbi:MAG: fatty acid desaturase [Nitrospirae bacterium]|nr:fatty acid desaturase [Nitrospirota bacterium]
MFNGDHWTAAIVSALISAQLNNISATVFLHRCMAHRSLDLHPAAAHFMRFWIWLTTGMVTKEWVAVHRKHHAFVDREGDPHSPKVEGFWNIFLRGVVYYRRASRDPEVLEKYGRGTPEDWIEKRIYTPLNIVGVLLLLAICCAVFGWLPGLIAWLIQILWHPFLGNSLINGVGHYFGYRNHPTDDASRNLWPWAIVAGGEELHNNHHRYPRSARFSEHWWEFDLGWTAVHALRKAGLAGAIYVRDRSYAEIKSVRWIGRMESTLQLWTETLHHLAGDSKLSLPEKRIRLAGHLAEGMRNLERGYFKLQSEMQPHCEKVVSEFMDRMQRAYDQWVAVLPVPVPA